MKPAFGCLLLLAFLGCAQAIYFSSLDAAVKGLPELSLLAAQLDTVAPTLAAQLRAPTFVGTLFAPTNTTLSKLAPYQSAIPAATMLDFFSMAVIPGPPIKLSDLVDGAVLVTLNNKTVTVKITQAADGSGPIYYINGARITGGNVYAGNSIIHETFSLVVPPANQGTLNVVLRDVANPPATQNLSPAGPPQPSPSPSPAAVPSPSPSPAAASPAPPTTASPSPSPAVVTSSSPSPAVVSSPSPSPAAGASPSPAAASPSPAVVASPSPAAASPSPAVVASPSPSPAPVKSPSPSPAASPSPAPATPSPAPATPTPAPATPTPAPPTSGGSDSGEVINIPQPLPSPSPANTGGNGAIVTESGGKTNTSIVPSTTNTTKLGGVYSAAGKSVVGAMVLIMPAVLGTLLLL